MRTAALLLAACCLMTALVDCALAASVSSPAVATIADTMKMGDETYVETTIAGECRSIMMGVEKFEKDFCDLTGDYTYRLTYRGANCTNPTDACQRSMAPDTIQGRRWTCENPTASPVQPLGEWPPAGWLAYISNLNIASGMYTCEPADGTKVVHDRTEAYPLGDCIPRDVMARWGRPPTTGLFEAQLCANDGLSHGKVLFSDSSCTKPVHALMRSTGCCLDFMKTCPANSTAMPPLPTITRANYQGSECDPLLDVSNQGTVDHFVGDLCLDGQRVQCVTDAATGIKAVIVTSYKNENRTGACNAVEETNTYLVETCVKSTVWGNTRFGRPTSFRFSCPTASSP